MNPQREKMENCTQSNQKLHKSTVKDGLLQMHHQLIMLKFRTLLTGTRFICIHLYHIINKHTLSLIF